jgi:hypothetical protein
MPQVKLQNLSGRRVTNGELVRIYPGKINAFTVAQLTEFGIIGTISGNIDVGQYGMINLINTVKWDDLLGVPTVIPWTIPLSAIEDFPTDFDITDFHTDNLLSESGNHLITENGHNLIL